MSTEGGGDGGEVEVEVAVFGVEDFEVAGDGFAGAGDAFPIEAGNARHQQLADDFVAEAEEFLGGGVDEGDAAFFIEDDDAFVEGFEDLLEEAFFPDEAGKELLGLGRIDAVEAGEEFFEEAGFHGDLGFTGRKGGWFSEKLGVLGVSNSAKRTRKGA